MGGDNELTRASAEAPRGDERLAKLERDNERLRALVDQHTRAASVGAFSLGLLHDINNALACVLGLNALAKDAGDEEREVLRSSVDQEAWRAAHLAQDLLLLGRTPVGHNPDRPIDVDSHVLRFGKSYSRLLSGTATEFVVRCDAQNAHVKIDPISIGRVVSNLISNARDAMGNVGDGELIVETRKVELQPVRAAQLRVPTGTFVELSVRDTGRGILSRDLARIFEPFYSTKPSDAGTGLGLAVVHEIVRNARGTIDVSSDFGRGTRIDVLLPVCEPPAEAATTAQSRGDDGAAITTATRLLLIESDPRLRAIWASLLQARGYRVDAVDGRLAQLLAASPPADRPSWDLVIDDDSAKGQFKEIPQIRTHGDPTGQTEGLTRPFGPTSLLRAVDHAVRGTE